jgi:hypothetical protein
VFEECPECQQREQAVRPCQKFGCRHFLTQLEAPVLLRYDVSRGPGNTICHLMVRISVFLIAILLSLCLEADAFTGRIFGVDFSLAPKAVRGLETSRPTERNFGVIGAVRNTWRRAFPARKASPSSFRSLSSASTSKNAANSGTVNLIQGPLGPFYAKLTRISNILTSLFPLWVLTAVIVALVKPTTLTWVTSDIITLFVGATMVFTGMTLEVDDFLKILKQPSQVRCDPSPNHLHI